MENNGQPGGNGINNIVSKILIYKIPRQYITSILGTIPCDLATCIFATYTDPWIDEMRHIIVIAQ